MVLSKHLASYHVDSIRISPLMVRLFDDRRIQNHTFSVEPTTSVASASVSFIRVALLRSQIGQTLIMSNLR